MILQTSFAFNEAPKHIKCSCKYCFTELAQGNLNSPAEWENRALYWLTNLSDLRSSFHLSSREEGLSFLAPHILIIESQYEKQGLSLHWPAKEQLPITAKGRAFQAGKAILKLAFPFENVERFVPFCTRLTFQVCQIQETRKLTTVCSLFFLTT